MISREEADYVLESLTCCRPALLFAAFTGCCCLPPA
jgi:hypothetical protein